MKIIADTHTHTIASEHAYSTLLENIAAAKKAGLEFLATTDHAPAIDGAPTKYFFNNLKCLPEEYDGVKILRGVELNVLDPQGSIDLPYEILDRLDIAIASMHPIVTGYFSFEDTTRAWLSIAQNPHVDIIGHCGDERYAFDHEKVIKAFKEYDKVVEINSSSFRIRPNAAKNCTDIALECIKYGVKMVVSSDSHMVNHIGDFSLALEKLAGINCPEECILNADRDRFLEFVNSKAPRVIK